MREALLSPAATAFLEAHGVPNGTPDAIDSFGLVGALHDYFKYEIVEEIVGPYPLFRNDNDYVERVLRLFHAKCIPIVTNPIFYILNREYDKILGDFLKNKQFKAKAMVFNYLFWTDEEPSHGVGQYGQSELALDPRHWQERMDESGAYVGVNVTSYYKELPTKFIAQEPFELVLRQEFGTNARREKHLDLVVRRGWQPGAHLIAEAQQIPTLVGTF